MDIDNFQQNMNTRVVFKEPRGMVRWLQLFFAIIAFSTVADFTTNIGIEITCPIGTTSTTTSTTTTTTTTTTTVAPGVVASPAPAQPAAVVPIPVAPQPAVPQPLQQASTKFTSKLNIKYPFDFSQQTIQNQCPGHNYTYTHLTSLEASPQFFVMTGVLALIYATFSLAIYLFFSSTYESVPIWPVGDLIIGAILCLFWFIAATSFSSGVTILKSTLIYDNVQQTLCPKPFTDLPGTQCTMTDEPSWKSLNVALVSGFTSFFLWGAGLWFVYKETHFHGQRDTYGPR